MKMKNLLYLFIATILAFSACKKEPYVDSQAVALAQFGKDTVIINKFIADNNIPAIKDEYGVYYQITDPGTGTVVPNNNSIVTVKYTGRLLDGTVFDSTKTDSTYTNYLGNLIVGWRIGIRKIKSGGKIRLIIPSGYAYGSAAPGTIPSNSILDFDIELKDVK